MCSRISYASLVLALIEERASTLIARILLRVVTIYNYLNLCYGSGSAWIHIDLDVLDPNQYWESGFRSMET
jgi:hypothetical protein